MLPAIRLGAPPAFLTADGADGARLLAVAADGLLRLWDLRAATLELEASVEPLLAGLAPGTTGAQPGLPLHCHRATCDPAHRFHHEKVPRLALLQDCPVIICRKVVAQ